MKSMTSCDPTGPDCGRQAWPSLLMRLQHLWCGEAAPEPNQAAYSEKSATVEAAEFSQRVTRPRWFW